MVNDRSEAVKRPQTGTAKAIENASAAPEDRAALAPRAGLCAACRHLQALRSKRSLFARCARSDDDPRFPRYPVLPVLDCPGYQPGAATPIHCDPG